MELFLLWLIGILALLFSMMAAHDMLEKTTLG